jgi:hypothetical protein
VLHCAKAIAVDAKTKIHSVGDGAVWIAAQIEVQFGSNATYLSRFLSSL